jgi:NADH dehydrogenase
MKLPRFDRKLRVMLDWTLDLFFPRDLNHLSPRFTKTVKEIYLERGDVLFHQDEPAFSFYIVKSGELELRENGETLQRISTGGFFSEHALLGDGVWHYEARATQPTNLVSIPANIFRELVRGVGSLGTFFQKSATKYQSKEIVEAIGRKIAPQVASQPVSRVMERTLYTLRPDMTIREAMQITREHPRSSYPVVENGNKLLGTVTREEFYEFIKREQTAPTTRLSEMHYATVPTVRDGSSVQDVMQCFIRTGWNKVLVVDQNNRLEGIATVMDLMAADGGGQNPRAAGAETKAI